MRHGTLLNTGSSGFGGTAMISPMASRDLRTVVAIELKMSANNALQNAREVNGEPFTISDSQRYQLS